MQQGRSWSGFKNKSWKWKTKQNKTRQKLEKQARRGLDQWPVRYQRSALPTELSNQLGVDLVKGIREPHEVKKKSFDLGANRTHDLRIRSTVTLPTELRGTL